jgi:hypothetical protein
MFDRAKCKREWRREDVKLVVVVAVDAFVLCPCAGLHEVLISLIYSLSCFLSYQICPFSLECRGKASHGVLLCFVSKSAKNGKRFSKTAFSIPKMLPTILNGLLSLIILKQRCADSISALLFGLAITITELQEAGFMCFPETTACAKYVRSLTKVLQKIFDVLSCRCQERVGLKGT